MQLGTESGVVPFTADNFRAREAYRPAYDKVAEVLCALLPFERAIDIGSGQGFLVDALLSKGIDVYGIEVSSDCLEFASPQATERTSIANALWASVNVLFDLVCCVEVAEHIEPHNSPTLVNQLCRMAKDKIYFTAASPFQPGHGHINCRPATDWVWYFHQNGWRLDIEATIDIRTRLGTQGVAPWISMNSMLFTKES